MKPGYKTTEFYLAIIGQALSLLAVLGIINAGDVRPMHQLIGEMIAAGVVVVAGAWQVVSYIKSRTELKK